MKRSEATAIPKVGIRAFAQQPFPESRTPMPHRVDQRRLSVEHLVYSGTVSPQVFCRTEVVGERHREHAIVRLRTVLQQVRAQPPIASPRERVPEGGRRKRLAAVRNRLHSVDIGSGLQQDARRRYCGGGVGTRHSLPCTDVQRGPARRVAKRDEIRPFAHRCRNLARATFVRRQRNPSC